MTSTLTFLHLWLSRRDRAYPLENPPERGSWPHFQSSGSAPCTPFAPRRYSNPQLQVFLGSRRGSPEVGSCSLPPTYLRANHGTQNRPRSHGGRGTPSCGMSPSPLLRC